MAKKIVLNGLDCFLLPQKVLYIPFYHLLVVSDWHLGKMKHFRKEGLFVPPVEVEEEIRRLELLFQELTVERVILLGDLFHSDWNEDWTAFALFTHRYPNISFLLTRGNHDILVNAHWAEARLQIIPQYILAEGLLFSHEPVADLPAYMFNIVGHLHPGCVVRGKGRQQFRLPCFHLKNNVLTLPAYGKWTGLHILPKEDNARFFSVIYDEVVEIKEFI
ncbi:ligase-associated DNA damage response endonuclease PdeM [Sphingobacterium spiritivorum]|uniref:ligase-associated DNA damage response endonuclease PdeM n=1 Tax=Sphingobacterium spiritivorum TaxID=258 RepID=UPI003DA436C3